MKSRNMLNCSVLMLSLVVQFVVSIFASKVVEGSQPVLQTTVETLFKDRSEAIYPGACKIIRSSNRQTKMCHRETTLPKTLSLAREQAVNSCEEAFRYDRWNCSTELLFKKSKKSIFLKIYRETAFVHALIAASITHAVARACATGDLMRCSCRGHFRRNTTMQWKGTGCGDDFKYGKRFTRNFLDFKHAGADQIGEIFKQDVIVGIDSIGEQLREVCKCHGFSGSCTTKTCWRRLGPFNSAMGLLKKHYHHAVKKKISNYTTKRAIAPKARKRLNVDRKNLVYLQKTPNLCVTTKGRVCRDRDNCATLCCGRGYISSKKTVKTRCNCKMVNCCFVQCDTCMKDVDYFVCK